MGVFSLQEWDIQRQHGDKASGFMLLDRNDDGLKWRLALIDSAQYSLDLQYYLWYGDDSGLLLMHRGIALDIGRRSFGHPARPGFSAAH